MEVGSNLVVRVLAIFALLYSAATLFLSLSHMFTRVYILPSGFVCVDVCLLGLRRVFIILLHSLQLLPLLRSGICRNFRPYFRITCGNHLFPAVFPGYFRIISGN